jgi:hypothetical protein
MTKIITEPSQDLLERAERLAQILSLSPTSGADIPENAEELAAMDLKELQSRAKNQLKSASSLSHEDMVALQSVLSTKGRVAYEKAKVQLRKDKFESYSATLDLIEQVQSARAALHQTTARPKVSRNKVILMALELGIAEMERQNGD